MTLTGHPPVDDAPRVTAEWLNLLADDLDWVDRGRTYLLLTETLHALRDYLTVDEAADLAAQLPLIFKGIWFSGWNPTATPVHPRSKGDFLDRVALRFSKEPLGNAERAVAAVFDLLRRKVSPGEIAHVVRALPAPLQDLWA
jgi:uncharacterized protein (DUF2267 family)